MRCVLSARFITSRDGIHYSVWNKPIQSGSVRTSGAQYIRGGIQSVRRSIPAGMERMDQTAFPDALVPVTRPVKDSKVRFNFWIR